MTKSIYTVYKITNNINNKIYIGVHKTTNPNDSYLGSGIAIKSAIQKYSTESFSKSILFEYDNKKDAYLKESQIVTNSFIKQSNNYNIKIGGYGGYPNKKGISLTLEHKSKIGYSNKGKTYPYKERILRKNQCMGKNNHKFKGYYITPWGKFESRILASTTLMKSRCISNWCKNSNTIITKNTLSRNKYLQSLNENPIGKSYNDLGFSFEKS